MQHCLHGQNNCIPNYIWEGESIAVTSGLSWNAKLLGEACHTLKQGLSTGYPSKQLGSRIAVTHLATTWACLALRSAFKALICPAPAWHQAGGQTRQSLPGGGAEIVECVLRRHPPGSASSKVMWRLVAYCFICLFCNFTAAIFHCIVILLYLLLNVVSSVVHFLIEK